MAERTLYFYSQNKPVFLCLLSLLKLDLIQTRTVGSILNAYHMS